MPQTLLHRLRGSIFVDGVSTFELSTVWNHSRRGRSFLVPGRARLTEAQGFNPVQPAGPPSIGRLHLTPAPGGPSPACPTHSYLLSVCEIYLGCRRCTHAHFKQYTIHLPARLRGSTTCEEGLVAKKAAPVDFAEAERIRQLGYDRERMLKRMPGVRARLSSRRIQVPLRVQGVTSTDVDKLGVGRKRRGLVLAPFPSVTSLVGRSVLALLPCNQWQHRSREYSHKWELPTQIADAN